MGRMLSMRRIVLKDQRFVFVDYMIYLVIGKVVMTGGIGSARPGAAVFEAPKQDL